MGLRQETEEDWLEIRTSNQSQKVAGGIDRIPGMPDEEHTGKYWVDLLRKNAQERRESELKKYGGEGYQKRQQAKRVVIEAVIERINPFVDEARKRGFVFFQCDLELMPSFALLLYFADGRGHFYSRSIGLERLMNKHVTLPGIMDHHDIKNAIHFYVRGLDGIRMLERSMRRKRIRAKS
jgi:hypothetical protein